MKKTILLASGLLCVATSGANDFADAPIIYIKASRAPLQAARIISSVRVINRDDIQFRSKQDTAELLREVNGLELGRNGGPGQTASVFLRGTESDHTLVLLDGVPINPATIGNAPLEQLSTSLLQRVEVVRGPLSSLQGSSAIGGVINLMTAESVPQGTRQYVHAKAGSYDTIQLQTGVQHAEGPFSVNLNLGHTDTEGFATRKGGGSDSGYTNNNLSGFVSYQFGDHRLKLQTLQTRGNTEYLGGFAAPYTPIDQDVANSLISASLRSDITADWKSNLTLSRFRNEIDQNQANFLAQFDYTHSQRDRLDWQNDWDINRNHRLTGGITIEEESIDSLSFGTAIDTEIDNQAAYLSTQHRWGKHQLTTAARLNHHELFGNHTTWNLGYGINVGDNTLVRASAGTAFRAPTATDLFGYGGNTALDPETSNSIEVGLSHEFDNRQSIDVAAYKTRIKDLIITNFYDLDGVDQFSDGFLLDDPLNENVNRANIKGIEFSYQYQSLPWTFGFGADLKRPWDESNDVILSRRARITANASLRYEQDNWRIGTNVQHQGKRDDSLFNNVQLGSYAVVNANAQWRFSKNVVLEGQIENLFDRDYELAGTYNTPGRSAYLGVRITSD